MASIGKEPKSGRWYIRFVYGKRQINRTLGKIDETQARGILGQVEEALSLLRRGILVLPEGSDPIDVIINGGRAVAKPNLPDRTTLADIGGKWVASITGSVADSTLYGIGIHLKHLKTTIGAKYPIADITHAKLQAYVTKRCGSVSSETARKEMRTFGQLWRFARREKIVTGDPPWHGLRYPVYQGKSPFKTWEEIEAMAEPDWESLYLDIGRVRELLLFVKEQAEYPFIFPMYSMTCWTGCRRAEVCRSEVSDWNLSTGTVLIRERKRRHGKHTVRTVPIHSDLRSAIEPWLPQCKQYVIHKSGKQLTKDMANHHFKHPLIGSKWAVLKGFHVLRHSFVSNLACSGVPQAFIDAWSGHSTDEQRERYRHLFPHKQRQAIDSMGGLFGG